MPVEIVIGGRLLPIGLTDRIRRARCGASEGRDWLAGLNRGRRLSGDAVEMPERKRKLDRQRKQRQPRAMFDVRRNHFMPIGVPASDGRKHLGRSNVII